MSVDHLINLSCAIGRVGVSFEHLTAGMLRFKRSLVLMYATFECGDWPDCFRLLNRYLRTDLEPRDISGSRWEA